MCCSCCQRRAGFRHATVAPSACHQSFEGGGDGTSRRITASTHRTRQFARHCQRLNHGHQGTRSEPMVLRPRVLLIAATRLPLCAKTLMLSRQHVPLHDLRRSHPGQTYASRLLLRVPRPRTSAPRLFSCKRYGQTLRNSILDSKSKVATTTYVCVASSICDPTRLHGQPTGAEGEFDIMLPVVIEAAGEAVRPCSRSGEAVS